MAYPANEPDDERSAPEELLYLIETYEDLETKRHDLAGEQKEVMATAKSRGYDTKILKRLIALRKRDPEDVAEEEAILTTYKAAIGMAT